MVRKRGYHTRARAKRTRPKAPAPKTGWRIAELAELSQISRRTLRYYLEHGLIVPTEFRGTATRYQRRELLRALAISHLRAETGASLVEIKRKLDALGDPELEAWVRSKPLPPSAAAALGAATEKQSEDDVHSETAQPRLRQSTSAWQRVSLLPGLELMIAADASPLVLRAAQKILEDCVGFTVESAHASV